MQAIETQYAGCKFRSRLEARWAVLLDNLGLEWMYEPQPYPTPAGVYLPDFWLPNWRGAGLWLEIKGTEPTGRELDKVAWFSRTPPGDDVRGFSRVGMAIGDIPRTAPDGIYLDSVYRDVEYQVEVDPICPIRLTAGSTDAACACQLFEIWRSQISPCSFRLISGPAVQPALDAARSARFGWGGA